jgi:anti-anti-sigma factor
MQSHHIKQNDQSLIVMYTGSITEHFPPPMPEFQKAFEFSCYGVVLDLSNVDYISSTGVSSLLETVKYMNEKGLDVVLCSANPHVLKVLRLARTELLLPIAENRDEGSKMLYNLRGKRQLPKRENILLINGELKIHSSLIALLKETEQYANYNIVTALNADRAWKILAGKSIHVVILDVTTPMISGEKLLKKIRTTPDTVGLPFLVASDERHMVNAVYYSKNGADDILRVPFSVHETPIRLRTALSIYYSWQEKLKNATPDQYGTNPRPLGSW